MGDWVVKRGEEDMSKTGWKKENISQYLKINTKEKYKTKHHGNFPHKLLILEYNILIYTVSKKKKMSL